VLPILPNVHFFVAIVLYGDKTVGGERKQSKRRHENDGTQRYDLLRGMDNISGIFSGTYVTVASGHSIGASFQTI
jgi:hypothetical protein